MPLKIYLCAFLNEEYVKEAKICIQSIRTAGRFKGDIYLFTDRNVKIDSVTIIKVRCKTVPLSASYRTRLFEHIHDHSPDDVFLYLDTDVVILKPIPSFDTIGDKIQVYSYTTKKQDNECFCGFITDDVHFTSKDAMCSGILVFRPNKKVKEVFDKAYTLYLDLISKEKINCCWEQPAFCYTLIDMDMYEISLNDLVYEERTQEKIGDSVVFNHFCGLRGKARFKGMLKYIQEQGV